jgi:rod shape determining protein RodA
VERPWYQSINWVLIAAAVSIGALGVVLIYSAGLRDASSAGEWRKQIVYLVLGVCIMAGVASVDYRWWRRAAPWLYGINLALLAFVLRGGHSALGAVRWISLGPLGTFQPSEPAKVIVAIALAALLAHYKTVNWRVMLYAVGAFVVPALLVLKQPDLGTSLVLLAILSTMLFFAAASIRDYLVYAAAVGAAGVFVVGTNAVLKPFQRARLLVFLHPNADPEGAGWNLNQAKIAVGSGGLTGQGLFHGTQTQLNFVPEHSRDFIFTVLGEELGFLGAIVLLGLYTLVLLGAVRAMLAAKDRFGLYLAAGLTAMIAFHIVVNIGMTIGIMPITGIPLPFMSYGGSAILTNFIAVGILLNIYKRRDALEF